MPNTNFSTNPNNNNPNIFEVLSGDRPFTVYVDLSPNAMFKIAIVVFGAVFVAFILGKAMK